MFVCYTKPGTINTSTFTIVLCLTNLTPPVNKCVYIESLFAMKQYAYMNQLDKNRFQIAKHRSSFNIKAQLLFKITAK